MHLDETFVARPSGVLVLQAIRRGQVIEDWSDENLVVDNYKVTHARMLGGDTANRNVAKISLGTNGTPPAAGNTVITGAFSKALSSVVYPTPNQVRFSFSIGTAEANGLAIMEFGLLTAGDLLYARKTRSAALNKDSDISLTGTWTITF